MPNLCQTTRKWNKFSLDLTSIFKMAKQERSLVVNDYAFYWYLKKLIKFIIKQNYW